MLLLDFSLISFLQASMIAMRHEQKSAVLVQLIQPGCSGSTLILLHTPPRTNNSKETLAEKWAKNEQ